MTVAEMRAELLTRVKVLTYRSGGIYCAVPVEEASPARVRRAYEAWFGKPTEWSGWSV